MDRLKGSINFLSRSTNFSLLFRVVNYNHILDHLFGHRNAVWPKQHRNTTAWWFPMLSSRVTTVNPFSHLNLQQFAGISNLSWGHILSHEISNAVTNICGSHFSAQFRVTVKNAVDVSWPMKLNVLRLAWHVLLFLLGRKSIPTSIGLNHRLWRKR